MHSNQSTSCAPNLASAQPQAGAIRSACYVEPAPMMDVMLEQLRYLLSHKSPHCHVECPDCARLSGAQSWLLLPFRATATRGSFPPANEIGRAHV